VSCDGPRHNRADCSNDDKFVAAEFTARRRCGLSRARENIGLADAGVTGTISLNGGDQDLETTLIRVRPKAGCCCASARVGRDIQAPRASGECAAGPLVWQSKSQRGAGHGLVTLITDLDDTIPAGAALDVVDGAVTVNHDDLQSGPGLSDRQALEGDHAEEQHSNEPELHISSFLTVALLHAVDQLRMLMSSTI